jgi:hypothetical protein
MSGRCGDERPVILVVEADALAGTAGRCKLALDREARAIVEALGPRAHRRFDVRVVQAATIEDVMHAILEWRPMILHFAAHAVPAATEASRGAGEQRNIVPPGMGAGAGSGSGESGAILLVDDHGAPQPVPGAALANVLAVADSPIRLLVLATCEGEAIADAVRHQVDAVIGFEGGLQDRAAPSLAELYWGLGRGQPLGQAYRQAVAILAVKYPFERVIHRVRPGLTLDDIVLAPSPHPSSHPSPRRLGRLRRTAGCLAFVLLAATAGAAVGRLIDVIDARGSMRPISKPIEPELTDSRVPQWEDAEWRHQPPSPLPPAPPEPPVPPVPRAQVAPPAPRALRRVAPPDRAQLHLALPAPAQLAPVETAPRPIARPPVAPSPRPARPGRARSAISTWRSSGVMSHDLVTKFGTATSCSSRSRLIPRSASRRRRGSSSPPTVACRP